jgi:trimethylamine:corrinoid methyltransferase-like protein
MRGWLPRDRTQSHSEARGETLATGPFAELGLSGEFLGARHTRQRFKAEQ